MSQQPTRSKRHRTRASGATVQGNLARTDRARAGEWLFTCRAGFERDLVEDLSRARRRDAAEPSVLAPAVVLAGQVPRRHDGNLDLTFARQGFRVAATTEGGRDATPELAEHVIKLASGAQAHALHVWSPDTDAGNRLASAASRVHDEVLRLLQNRVPDVAARKVPVDRLREASGLLIQVCLLPDGAAIVGSVPAREALSLAPGGRERMRVPHDVPARSAMKLAEAFSWLGMGPEPGELCVDLGAAPGGWSRVLLERRARVIAVDPAKMHPSLARFRGLKHVCASAFDFTPDEPVDWLLCDMAWRPLEVAALLAKWGRRRLTRTVVANIKLAMKKKVEMLRTVTKTLEDAGYVDVRTRHLYHDRDEVTLSAWRR